MAENFDLLGDPIPENFGRRGRPPHIPTTENRNKVMLLQAVGWTQGRIAEALGVTEPTLKRHYFRELRARGEARSRMLGTYHFRVWTKAMEGDTGAMRLLSQLLEREGVLGVKPPQTVDDRTGRPAEKVGKKEQLNRDAQTPTGDWEDLLGADAGEPH